MKSALRFVLLLCGSIAVFLLVVYSAEFRSTVPVPTSAHAQVTGESSEPGGNQPEIRIYSVPPAFRCSYVPLLSALLTSSTEYIMSLYPQSAGDIEDSTAEEDSPRTLPELSTVVFDPERGILSVLGNQEEHRAVERFLKGLDNTKKGIRNIIYRVAVAKRSIDPALKDYPFEFDIEGRCWDEGRNGHRYPKWLDDRHKKYPSIKFDDVDVDRDDDHTSFDVEGYARNKKDLCALIKAVEESCDTKERIDVEEHDFMKESTENLRSSLSEIFVEQTVGTLVPSLQKLEIYQIRLLGSSFGESAIPGFYRTSLDKRYGIEIRVEEGIRKDGMFQADISCYRRNDGDDAFFEEDFLELASSLYTRFGQANLLGLREDPGQRYFLIVCIDEGKL